MRGKSVFFRSTMLSLLKNSPHIQLYLLDLKRGVEVKEAISTEILDNLAGRMTFRMISTAASNVAMSGNYAQKLPAIKGRAVWSNGSEQKQVQAPYVDDGTIESELDGISQEFADGIRKNFNPLLEVRDDDKISDTADHV